MRAGSSPSATTRATIAPTVGQAMRSSRVTAVLSILLVHQATRSSKSRVNRARCRANGTCSTMTPWSGQSNRRSRAVTTVSHAPRSRLRHHDGSGRVSKRARVRVAAAVDRTQQPAATQPHRHAHLAVVEADVFDDHPLKTQEHVECRGDAHGDVTFRSQA